MRLVEIFGISQKSKIFDGRNKSGILTMVSRYKILQKCTGSFENWQFMSKIPVLYWDFWQSTVSVKNRRLFSRFSTYVENSCIIFDVFGHFIYWQMTKMVKNPKNYTRNFDCWLLTVNFRQAVKNVPKYLTFDYWLSRYKTWTVTRTHGSSGSTSLFREGD